MNMKYRPTHTRGESLPIDLDGIETRWASQWNESDDGEVRAWRTDVAALIDEVHRLRRVSNGYFEEMVRRTPALSNAESPAESPRANVSVEVLADALGWWNREGWLWWSENDQAIAILARINEKTT